MREIRTTKKTVTVILAMLMMLVFTACNKEKQNPEEKELIDRLITLTTPEQMLENTGAFSVDATYESNGETKYTMKANFIKNNDGLYETSCTLDMGAPVDFYLNSDEKDPFFYEVINHRDSQEANRWVINDQVNQPYEIVKIKFTDPFTESYADTGHVVFDEMRDGKRYVMVSRKESHNNNEIFYTFLFDESGEKIEEYTFDRKIPDTRIHYEFTYEPTVVINRKPKEILGGYDPIDIDNLTVEEVIRRLTPSNIVDEFGPFSYDENDPVKEQLNIYHVSKFVKNDAGYYEMNTETIQPDEPYQIYINTAENDAKYYCTNSYMADMMNEDGPIENPITSCLVRSMDPERAQIVSSVTEGHMYVVTVDEPKDFGGLTVVFRDVFYFDDSSGKLIKWISGQDPSMATTYEFEYDPDLTLAFVPYAPIRATEEVMNGVSMDDLIRLTTPNESVDSQGSYLINVFEENGEYHEYLATFKYVKNPDGYYEWNREIVYDNGDFDYIYLNSREDDPYFYQSTNVGSDKNDKNIYYGGFLDVSPWGVDDGGLLVASFMGLESGALWEDSFYGLDSGDNRITTVSKDGSDYVVNINRYDDGVVSTTFEITIDANKERVLKAVATVDDLAPIIYEYTYNTDVELSYIP